jgi:hypothetical protein
VYHDTNDDNSLAGEPTMSGVTVFLDTNNNGGLDAGEVSAISGGAGSYLFSNLPDGTYTVRVAAAPAGFVSTASASATVLGGAASTGANLPNERIVYGGGGSGDDYKLRKNGAGKYEILIGGSATPAYTVFAAAPSLGFNLGAGGDTLTLDLVNGVPIPAGGVALDGGADADTLAIAGSASADTITFSAGGVSIGAGVFSRPGGLVWPDRSC